MLYTHQTSVAGSEGDTLCVCVCITHSSLRGEGSVFNTAFEATLHVGYPPEGVFSICTRHVWPGLKVSMCVARSSLRDEGSAPQPQDAQDGNEFAPVGEAPYGNNYGRPGTPCAPCRRSLAACLVPDCLLCQHSSSESTAGVSTWLLAHADVSCLASGCTAAAASAQWPLSCRSAGYAGAEA